MKFHLTTEARKDLVAIAKYTEQNWGKEQRNIYLDKVDKMFHTIIKFPNVGKSCDEVKKGYRKLSVGRHLIFYRKFSQEQIKIIRILHESMDIESHFCFF